MSGKRLSKRQLREQQDLRALSGSTPEEQRKEATKRKNDEGEEGGQVFEPEINTEASGGGGIFSKLGEVEGDAGEGSDDVDDTQEHMEVVNASEQTISKRKQKSKRKKKAALYLLDEDVDSAMSTGGQSTPKKDASTKLRSTNIKGAGKAAPKDVSSMSMDEFSAVLESQIKLDDRKNIKNDKSGQGNSRTSEPLSVLRAHLALFAPFLDPTVELKRHFGAAAIKAYENEANSNGQARGAGSANAARARAMAWNTNFKVKSILIQPQDTWPPIAKTFTGMTMETIEDQERGKVGGWVHSKAYRKAQLQFLQAVQSYEPNQLITLLRLYPWHIDTLLQVSEVSRHQGDLGAASDWNSRALFAYERNSTTVFSSSLISSNGPPLLSFDRIENRGFWIACHRQVNFLGRRGTWRTSLEWVKLMMGIDPTNDHHGMILWLDFLSIKSRQYKWFLDCLEKLEDAYSGEMDNRGILIVNAKTPFDSDKELIGEAKTSRGALDWCMGCAYAKALAFRAIEKEEGDKSGERSTAALRLAMARHPEMLPLLFDKIGISLPEETKESSIFDLNSAEADTIPQILAHIYVSRSESLWKDAEVGAWLRTSLKEISPILIGASKTICRPSADMQSRVGIYRHILVSDLPDALRQTLIGLIPQQISSDSSKLNSYDPLPPEPDGDKVTYYDDDYFESVTREGAQRHENQATTDAGIVNQFMNAIRGAQGLQGWENVMEDMDEDTREDVMAQILQLTAEAGGRDGMPGAYNDGNERFVRDGEDHNEQRRGTFAALRGVLGRLWGEERTEAALPGHIEGDDEDVQ